MNIIIANTQEFNPQIGGVEKVSNFLAEEFVKRGHNVIFLACLKSPYSKGYKPVVKQYFLSEKEYKCKKNVELFKSIIAQEKIDIVLNQAGNIKEFTDLCADATAKTIPLISAIHTSPRCCIELLDDFKYSKIIPLSYLKAIRRMILYPFRYKKALAFTSDTYFQVCRQSDSVVVLAEAYINQLKDFSDNADWRKIIAIPNSLDVEIKQYGKKEKIILYVGRLDFEQKRTDRILEIWEKLYNKYPDWELHIIGDGPLRLDLEEYTKRKKIQHVKYMGTINPQKEYMRASILCMTSTIEGFPMVLLEAISNGCVPIVYDSYAGVHDIIKNNKNGIIVPKFKKREYVRELCNLMKSEELRNRLTEEKYNTKEEYRSEIVIGKWLRLFENEKTYMKK